MSFGDAGADAGRVSVRTDGLATHAAQVRNLAGRAERAQAAASAVMLDVGAYGQLCCVLPHLLRPIQGHTVTAMGVAAAELAAVADALRTAADAYAGADAAAQRRLGGSPAGRAW